VFHNVSGAETPNFGPGEEAPLLSHSYSRLPVGGGAVARAEQEWEWLVNQEDRKATQFQASAALEWGLRRRGLELCLRPSLAGGFIAGSVGRPNSFEDELPESDKLLSHLLDGLCRPVVKAGDKLIGQDIPSRRSIF
jgi:hypothetical protein